MKLLPSSDALAADPPELVFQWERRTRAHWRLATIIAFSLLAHAVSFYVLQVSYTPTGSQLPPPAQVVMISPDSTDHEALNRWLGMADPSLVVQPVPPSRADTLAALNFRYVPSYEAARPGFKDLGTPWDNPATGNPPQPRAPGPVPLNLAAASPVAPAATPAAKRRETRVVLTGDIVSLLAGPLPPVDFASPAGQRLLEADKKPLEPTSFLVGVRPEGGAPFLFPRSKSASTAADSTSADDYAREYLARLEFRADPVASTVRWGYAEFAWGNDFYR